MMASGQHRPAGSGQSAACAACKYQRRRCAPDCPLAPYFPADQPKIFQNAHRLFGVSKILKVLEKLDDPHQRNEAMRSIVYQSNARAQYPVHGCVAIIYNLWLQIAQAQSDLAGLTNQIKFFRQIYAQQQQQQLMLDQGHAGLDVNIIATNNNIHQTSSSGSNNNHFNINSNELSLFNDEAVAAVPGHQMFDGDGGDGLGDGGGLNLFYGAAAAQQQYMQVPNPAVYNDIRMHAVESASGAAVAQSPFMDPSQLGNPTATVPGYVDEYSPYIDNIDDRQSYIDARDAYESSLDKDTVQSAMAEQVSENELRNAAAGFSLTNIK